MEAHAGAVKHHGRTVLVPQKTTIKFDAGISTITTAETKKPAVPSHRVPPQRKRSFANHSAQKYEVANDGIDSHIGTVELEGDLGEVSTSSVDVVLPENIMQAFMQNSPSAAHLMASSPMSAANAQIAKTRVLEEMNRIQQRSYVTEQQRQQYMQTALGMDAPKLARTIMKEEREAWADVFSAADARSAQQKQRRSGRAEPGEGSAGSEGSGLDLSESVSFLTGGELLLLEERSRAQQLESQQERRDISSPARRSSVLADQDQQHADPIATQDSLWKPAQTGTEGGGTVDSQDQEEGEGEDLDQTVRVVRQVSSAEKRQREDDARFSKTVEEVERIRRRYIQKASLPLLGSVSNVERLSSSSLDTGNRATEGSGGGTGWRPSSGAGASGSAGGGSSILGGIGAKIRKQASDLFSGGKVSRVPGAAGSRGSDQLDGPVPTLGQLGKATSSSSAGGGAGSTANSRRPSLTIDTLDAEPAAPDYPPLSPSLRRSPAQYLLLPSRAQRQRSGDGTESGTAASGAVQGREEAEDLGAKGEVYRVLSTSLSPKPGKTTASPFPFSGGAAGPDSPAGSSGAGIKRVKSIRADGAPLSPAVMRPEGLHGTVRGGQQELVTNSIDMLIGSRFNSDRDLDTSEEGGEEGLLDSSLALLQQKLDSASAASSSYRNVFAAKLQQQQQQMGAGGAQKGAYSAAAATALATLSRPGSAVKRTGRPSASTNAPQPQLGPPDLQMEGEAGPGQGTPMLHTDDSTSSLGSDMLFAFKVPGSNPTSAEKTATELRRSGTSFNSGTTSSLALSSDSGGSSNSSKFRHQPLGSQPQPQGGPLAHPVFHSTYDVLDHDQQQPPQQKRGKGGAAGPSGSSQTSSTYLLSTGEASGHPSGQIHLQPLPVTPGEGRRSRPVSGNRPSSMHSNALHLQPLEVPAGRVSLSEGVPAVKPSETPKYEPAAGAVSSSRRLSSAEKRGGRMRNNDPSPLGAAGGAVGGRGQAERAHPGRLSTFDLDASSQRSTPGQLSSQPSSAARSAVLSGSKVLGVPAPGSRAAKLRQNAQLLMASPLSEWLSAGASLHNTIQQLGLGPAGADPPQTAAAAAQQQPDGQEKKRRGSKFTFEELSTAELQLKNSPLKGIGRKDPSLDQSLSQVVSLPALLPSLAHADPSAVGDVYRSLNILSGHFATLGASSLGSSLQALHPAAGTPLSTDGAAAVAPNDKVAAIDRELDDLLSGGSVSNNHSPERPPVNNAAGSAVAVPVAASAMTSREIERGINMRRAGRPSRNHALISKSCMEGGASHIVGDVHSEPNLSALASAGAAVVGASAVAAQRAVSQDPSGGTGLGAGSQGQAAPLRAARSTSALPDHPSPSGDGHPRHPLPRHPAAAHTDTAAHSPSPAVSSPVTAPSSSTENTPGRVKVPTPVKAEIEGVVSHALGRSAVSARSANSTASTVDVQLRDTRGVPLVGRTALSANSSASNSSNAVSSQGSNPNLVAQHVQQQRLGALAAALDAGDAVGKLMAQMMLGSSAGNSGLTSGASSGAVSSANLRKR